MTLAFILGARCKPKKRKVILINILKKEPMEISIQSLLLSNLRLVRNTKGRKTKLAKKNLKNAKVKGGIFSKANLNTGNPPPHTTLAIISARIGFMTLTFYVRSLRSLY